MHHQHHHSKRQSMPPMHLMEHEREHGDQEVDVEAISAISYLMKNVASNSNMSNIVKGLNVSRTLIKSLDARIQQEEIKSERVSQEVEYLKGEQEKLQDLVESIARGERLNEDGSSTCNCNCSQLSQDIENISQDLDHFRLENEKLGKAVRILQQEKHQFKSTLEDLVNGQAEMKRFCDRVFAKQEKLEKMVIKKWLDPDNDN